MSKITAIAAVSIDGKIAAYAGYPTDWTSPEDKILMRNMLNHSNSVIAVGRKTFEIHKQQLSNRDCIVLTTEVDGFVKASEKLAYFNPLGNQKFAEISNRYAEIFVLGGCQTYSYFLRENLLDELFLTVEPIVFGKGIGIFQSETADSFFTRAKLVEFKRLNDCGSILLHYSFDRANMVTNPQGRSNGSICK